MRALLTAGLLLLAVPVSSSQWQYLAFEQITVAATAIGITATVIQPGGSGTQPQATVGSCRLETAQVRYTVNGTTPTTTVGTQLEIGDTVILNGTDILRLFRAIRTGGTSGVLNCNVAKP